MAWLSFTEELQPISLIIQVRPVVAVYMDLYYVHEYIYIYKYIDVTVSILFTVLDKNLCRWGYPQKVSRQV